MTPECPGCQAELTVDHSRQCGAFRAVTGRRFRHNATEVNRTIAMLEARVEALEAELQRRKGGRPRKDSGESLASRAS